MRSDKGSHVCVKRVTSQAARQPACQLAHGFASCAGGAAKRHGQRPTLSMHTFSSGTGTLAAALSVGLLWLAGQEQARWPGLYRRVANTLVAARPLTSLTPSTTIVYATTLVSLLGAVKKA